jgi:hypothetical protein
MTRSDELTQLGAGDLLAALGELSCAQAAPLYAALGFSPPDQGHPGQAGQDPADAVGQVQDTDPALAAVEHVHREDHEEDVQGADDHPLGAKQGDQQPRRGLACQHPEAGQGAGQPAASSTASAPIPRTVAANPADTKPATPATANTKPGPATVSRTPVAALEATTLALSIQPVKALAAVSSSALYTNPGTSGVCAGLVVATAADATTAPTYAASGASNPIANAVASIPATWTR